MQLEKPKPIKFVYTTHSAFEKAYQDFETQDCVYDVMIKDALKQGYLIDEQVLIAMNRAYINNISLESAFELIGILSQKGKL